jgi:hypothetical protein
MNSLDVGFFTYRYIYMFFDNYERILLGKDPDVFKNHNKLLSLNRVIKKENLSKALINICVNKGFCNEGEIIQISERQKTKVNTSKHKHYTHYYNKRLIGLVKHKDRLIIDKYGYRFG